MPMHFAICSSVIHRNQCIIKISRSFGDSRRSAVANRSFSISTTAFPTGKAVYSHVNCKLGHICLGQFFQRCKTFLMTADLPIAVTCLAFQHLFAVAVKGVLLVFVVAVWFQVFTSPRAGRQLFSSPFAHYSFTNGFIWLIFKIGMKIFVKMRGFIGCELKYIKSEPQLTSMSMARPYVI